MNFHFTRWAAEINKKFYSRAKELGTGSGTLPSVAVEGRHPYPFKLSTKKNSPFGLSSKDLIQQGRSNRGTKSRLHKRGVRDLSLEEREEILHDARAGALTQK